MADLFGEAGRELLGGSAALALGGDVIAACG